jgi:hypothetical protein
MRSFSRAVLSDRVWYRLADGCMAPGFVISAREVEVWGASEAHIEAPTWVNHCANSLKWNDPRVEVSRLSQRLRYDRTVETFLGMKSDARLNPAERTFANRIADYIGLLM